MVQVWWPDPSQPVSNHPGMFIETMGTLKSWMETWCFRQAVTLPSLWKNLLRTGSEQRKVELRDAERGRRTTRVQKCPEILKVT